jgi:hypothetical protein
MINPMTLKEPGSLEIGNNSRKSVWMSMKMRNRILASLMRRKFTV